MSTAHIIERRMTFGECLAALHQEGDYLVSDSLFIYEPEEYAQLQPRIALTAPAILRMDTISGNGELRVLGTPVFLQGPTSQSEIARYYADTLENTPVTDPGSYPPGAEQYSHVTQRSTGNTYSWTDNGIDPLVTSPKMRASMHWELSDTPEIYGIHNAKTFWTSTE